MEIKATTVISKILIFHYCWKCTDTSYFFHLPKLEEEGIREVTYNKLATNNFSTPNHNETVENFRNKVLELAPHPTMLVSFHKEIYYQSN